MDVHKVEFFVDDKKLAQINRLLTGLVFEYKAIPVATGNAQAVNGKIKTVGENGANGVLLKGLKPGVKLTSTEAQVKLVAAGYSRTRHHGALHTLKNGGVLQMVSPGVYQLATKKAKPLKKRNKA